MQLPIATSPQDGAKHRSNLALLNFVQSNPMTMASLTAAFPTWFSGTETLTYVPPTPLNSASMVVKDVANAKLLVVSLGMTQSAAGSTLPYQQIANVVYGLTSPDPGANGLFPYWSAAQVLFGNCQSNTTTWTQCELIGHSYGASVNGYLHLALASANNNPQIYNWQYGCPKMGHTGIPNAWAGTNIVHVAINLDCVPSVMPLSSQSPLVYAVNTLYQGAATRTYSPVQGYILDGNGNLTGPQAMGTLPPIGGGVAIAQWLSGVEVFGAVQHQLSFYTQLVGLIPAIVARGGSSSPAPEWTPANSGPQPFVPPTESATTPARTPTAQQRRIYQTVLNNAGLVNDDPTTAQLMATYQQFVPTIKGERYHSKIINHTRQIIFMNTPVMVCPRRRTARRVVRFLNQQLVDNGF